MTICLPDINVWIALTADRHVHHVTAREWLQKTTEQIAFCRITELGLLRLLTNSRVMEDEVLSPPDAWRIYDQWRADSRVAFLHEGADFSERWRKQGNGIVGGPNAWTDAYLAVFAEHINAAVITFDRAFPARNGVAVKILS